MSFASLPTPGMPNISVLSYSVLFDISGAVPTIVLTNNSTVSDYTKLKFWYIITTPSGTPIHMGDPVTPDVNGVSWTTLQIPTGSWPLIFGNAPCVQVEFSSTNPYNVILGVMDSDAGNLSFTLPVSQTIVRPNGNTQNTCGNFGVAQVLVQTKCNDKVVFCQDGTNFAYNSLLAPVAGTQTNVWTLAYPQDPNGNQPLAATATNTPYVNFPIQYSGGGYVLSLQDYATYDFGNGALVKLQYKAFDKKTGAPGLTFAVLCNIDLCKLQCQIRTFYEESKQKCGVVDEPELMIVMTRMNFLLNLAVIGIIQPLCGIDVPATIAEIQKLGNLPEDCNCGCTDTGVNFSYPLGPGNSTGGCCPVSVSIVNVTASPPTSCENTVYPVNVYDPTGTTVIGTAYDLNNVIYLLNSTPSWQAYGVAFSEGYCKVGFFPATTGNTIPNVTIAAATNSTACVGNTQNYIANLVDICFPTAPITASEFPMNAYVDFGSGVQWVGNVANQAAMIAAFNAAAGKPASVTFSAGASVSQVQVTNTNCSAFSTPINVFCDAGSTDFFALGASHGSEANGLPSGAVMGYGFRTNSIIGKTPTFPNAANYDWHTIIVPGTTMMLVSEANTGKIHMWDVSNPLMPSYVRALQLNSVVSNCFTGVPNSRGIGGGVVPSFFSLYFPTDQFTTMTLANVFVFEAITGSAWQIDMVAGAVLASFQDNRLIGKCPRVLAPVGTTRKIFFTQDGSLEGDSGQSSGVVPGDIVELDVSSFNSSGITTKSIFSGEYVWSAAFDGVDTIWFIGYAGELAQYSISTTATTLYSGIFGTGVKNQLRANAKFFNGKLYISSLGSYLTLTNIGVMVIDTTVLPTISRFTFAINTSNAQWGKYAHNVLPLGNCLVAVTGESASGISTPSGAISIYKVDGSYVNSVSSGSAKAIYNLVLFPGIRTYSPTNLV